MTSEKLIHVKLEYEEALQAKKDVLSSEIGLLRIAKAIKNYRLSRTDELKIKIQLHRKFKELETSIKKLQQVLPKIKIPEILEDYGSEGKERNKESEEKKYSPKKKDLYYDELDSELEEIQRKLRSLE